MYEIASVLALMLACLSLAGVVMLIVKREDHAQLESKLRSLDLELADVSDRLSVWQRRDAQRQRRSVGGSPADELGGSVPSQLSLVGVPDAKAALRARARAKLGG